MIVTTAPLSLLYYYVQQIGYEGKLIVARAADIQEYIDKGTPFQPITAVLEVSRLPDEEPPLGAYTSIYVSAPRSKKGTLNLTPERYRPLLDNLKFLTVEAREYLWNRYQLDPARLNAEILKLLVLYRHVGMVLTRDVLDHLEQSNLWDFYSLIGTIEGTRYLSHCSDGELFRLLIGNPLSLVHKWVFSTRCDGRYRFYQYLERVKTLFNEGGVSLRPLILAFHEWLRASGARFEQGRFVFDPDSASVNAFELLFS